MPTIQKQALSIYSAQQLYALVTDIEAYPDFFPLCVDASIVESRDESHCVGMLAFKKKWFEFKIITENTMAPNHSITMNLKEGPFSTFKATWSFIPKGPGAEVIFTLDYQLWPGVGKLLDMGVGKIFDEAMQAFLKEAEKRYEQ